MIALTEQKSVLYAPAWYDNRVHRGIARYAREAGWHLVADMAHAQIVPMGWRGDGIITARHRRRSDLCQFILAAECPIVELTGGCGKDGKIHSVTVDDSAIGRMGAEHFLERGFEHFAWVGFSRGDVHRHRINGFAGRLREEGYDCEILTWQREGTYGGGNWRERREWLLGRLDALPRPLAILVHNDPLAASVVDACRSAGIAVPGDVAILGIDNYDLVCTSLAVPLSSIDTNLEELGYRAARYLDHLIAGESPECPPKIMPRGVDVRQSTDCMAVNDPNVVVALGFIREHFRELISVNDVVAQTGVSRRPLELAFKRELHRTILDEITRQRIEHVKSLLIGTTLTLAEIAEASAFRSVPYMHRVFKKVTGKTPRRYRLDSASDNG